MGETFTVELPPPPPGGWTLSNFHIGHLKTEIPFPIDFPLGVPKP